jgi:hypothetical protein
MAMPAIKNMAAAIRPAGGKNQAVRRSMGSIYSDQDNLYLESYESHSPTPRIDFH